MKIGKAVRETVNWKPNVTPALGTEQFKINGQIVEKVDRFKLLGSWTLAKGKVNEHIKKRMQAAYDPIQGLNDDRLKLWYIFNKGWNKIFRARIKIKSRKINWWAIES